MKLNLSRWGGPVLLSLLMAIGCGQEAEFNGRTGQKSADADAIPEPQPSPDQGPDDVPESKPPETAPNDPTIPPPPVVNPPPPDNPPPVVKEPLQLTDSFRGQEDVKKRTPDIYFVVDTSDSMVYERAKLAAAMRRFMDQFKLLGVDDYHMVFIGEEPDQGKGFEFPLEVKTDYRLARVNIPVASADGLVRFVEVMDGKHSAVTTFGDPNKPFTVKSDRAAELVMVTDDNSAVSAQAFRDQLTRLNLKLNINGIIALKDIGSTTEFGRECRFNRTGYVYLDLIKNQNPEGLIQDICTEDWDALVKNLAVSIFDKISQYTFKLSKPVMVNKGVLVTIDQQTIDPSFYAIDSVAGTITFNKGHAPAKGTQVNVTYYTNP